MVISLGAPILFCSLLTNGLNAGVNMQAQNFLPAVIVHFAHMELLLPLQISPCCNHFQTSAMLTFHNKQLPYVFSKISYLLYNEPFK